MASSIIWNWKLLYSKHNFPFYLLIIELLIQKKPIVSLRLCANWAATPNLASRWCFLKREILEVENYFFMKTHDCSHEIKRRLLLGRKVMINRDSILKSRDITLPSKVHLVKAMVFPVVMCDDTWKLDHKESWAQKNWCFWAVVLEKTLESPLDCKEIQPVHPKGNRSWIFIGRTDVEAETPIFCPPDVNNQLIGKDPDAGKDWRWQEKGTTEHEMVGWHHQLNGHEFE